MKAPLIALALSIVSVSAHAELGIFCTSPEGVQAKIVSETPDRNVFTMEVQTSGSEKLQTDEYSVTKHQRFAFQSIAGQEFIEEYTADIVNANGTRYKAYLKLTKNGKGSLLSYRELDPVTVRCVRGI